MKALLITVVFIGIAAVAGTIIVGMSTFDGTVVDKPYEQGLAYDAVQKEREASGWNVDIANPTLSVGRNDLIISVTDRDGKHLSDISVSLTVSRPSTSAYDRTYKTIQNENGQFKAETDLPLYGYWDARIHVTSREKHLTFERQIFAGQGKK